MSVDVKSWAKNFDITVRTKSAETHFSNVIAKLTSPTTLSVELNNELASVTIVPQKPHAGVPASQSHHTMERIHVFDRGSKKTLVIPHPTWLLSLGGDVLNAAKGSLKAPMPSLVVEVKVQVGDKVDKGQALVVLESMKTETVLRADAKGIVKAVGCRKGEMVEEGRELIDIEAESQET